MGKKRTRRLVSDQFDPEGSGYDLKSALSAGMRKDKSGHMGSRVPSGPKEGLILKGRKHPTFHKTLEEELRLGNEIIKDKKTGRLFSRPMK